MTTGTTDGKVTTLADGPGGMPLVLPLERGVRRQRPVIGARPVEGGPTEWHGQAGGGDYHTLCGVSVDGDIFDAVPGNHRITCPQCRAIWSAARSIRAMDFAA
jgi:hypothetical protein